MFCRHYQKQISDSLQDGHTRSAELQKHLNTCTACHNFEQQLKAVDQGLRTGAKQLQADKELNADFHSQLMQQLQETDILPPPTSDTRKFWLAAAAVFILLAAGIAFILRAPPTTEHRPLSPRDSTPNSQAVTGSLLPDANQHFASLDRTVHQHTSLLYLEETENLKHDLQSVSQFLLQKSP